LSRVELLLLNSFSFWKGFLRNDILAVSRAVKLSSSQAWVAELGARA
jgi:hypothetical protein